MSDEFPALRRVSPLLYLILCAIASPAILLPGQPATFASGSSPAAQGQEPKARLPEPQAQELVQQALAAELQAAQDTSHPMRYLLRKSSPRFTSTKEIVETRDGDVARLRSIDDKPLDPANEQQEQARLDDLLADPGRQRHRKQQEDADAGRALKVLRALPIAFLYEDAGSAEGPSGTVEKFTFRPNPSFSPPDLESQILTQMTGVISVDLAQKRVVRLEGHLQQDVDFGWGILGRLNKGGWIAIDQAVVGGGQWRITRFQMVMSGRVVFKVRSFDTVEEQTRFAPVPGSIGYRDAVQLLRANNDGTASDPQSQQTTNAKRP